MMRFLSSPLWRAYTSTYVEGERLLRPWLEARPPAVSALQRFRRLLDEPLTPAAVRAETADATGSVDRAAAAAGDLTVLTSAADPALRVV